MTSNNRNTEDLLARVRDGDRLASNQLLDNHRARLRQVVSIRMDPRLSARVDPSDVIQEVMLEASQKLDKYHELEDFPFFSWLRQIAWERLMKLHRRHLTTQKRSARRENHFGMPMNDQSAIHLARILIDQGTDPGDRVLKQEMNRRVKEAMKKLNEDDQELITMRYLEQLSGREISAIMNITENNVKVRHFRAIRRLRALLD